MNVNASIQKFGDKGNQAFQKSLNQLLELQAILPKKKEDFTYKARKQALSYLIFLKKCMTLLSRPEDVLTDTCKDKPLPKHKQVLLRFTRGKDHVMRH